MYQDSKRMCTAIALLIKPYVWCRSRRRRCRRRGLPKLPVVLQRTAKKCTQNQNANAEPSFCSVNLLSSDVFVAVTIVVC